MAFEKELPQWKEKGVKPPQSKLDEGWKVQDKPPAAWLNWQMNKTYEALKEVQEKAAEKTEVASAIEDTKNYTDQKLSNVKPDLIGAETPQGAQTKADQAEKRAKDASLSRTGGDVHGGMTIHSNGGNGLSLVGTDHMYIPFYPHGVAAGRKGYIGFPGAGDNNLNVTVEGTGSLGLHAPSGSVRVSGETHIKGKTWLAKAAEWDGVAPAISVPIGDNDTGINWPGDGQLEVWSNNQPVMKISGNYVGFKDNVGNWTSLQDLKQSGVDAKNRIAGAVSAKGVPASANDSFDQLAGKIGQIYTGLPVARISKSLSSYKLSFRWNSNGGRNMYFVVVTGLGFRAKRITIQESSGVFPIAVCDVDKDPGIAWTRSLEPGEYDQKFLVKLADKLPDYSPSNLGWWEGTITQDGFIMPVTFSDYLAEREMYVVAIG